MPYLTVQEIETIAERIVRAYHRYCAPVSYTHLTLPTSAYV